MDDSSSSKLSDRALLELQKWDEERITNALKNAHARPKAEIGTEAVTALFEALSFDGLLDDDEVMSEMEQALLKLSTYHDLALTEGGRYPGVYKLLAHETPSLRALVLPKILASKSLISKDFETCIWQS